MKTVVSSDLLSKVISGDTKGQNLFFEKYKGLVMREAFKFTKDKSIADHLVSEIFCKLFKGISFYDSNQGTLATWMTRITKNHCVDYTRSLKRKKKIELVFYNEVYDHLLVTEPEDIFKPKGEKDILDLMEYLSNVDHEILVLKYFKKLSFDEIAIQLNIKNSTARGRAHRAKERLLKIISENT